MVEKKSKDLMFVKFDKMFAKECHKNFLCQSETAKFTLWKPTKTVEEAEEKLGYWAKNLGENDIFCLIQERESGEIIGYVCAYEIAPKIYGDIGLAIGREFIRKGYGSQSLNCLLETIKHRGAKEIHYSHLKGNDASKVLALKYGFEFYKQEKRLRKYDNQEFDELFYVLKF